MKFCELRNEAGRVTHMDNKNGVLEVVAMAETNTSNIGFEKQIWDAACVLRGNIDASEYKSVVLGLIFLELLLPCTRWLFANAVIRCKGAYSRQPVISANIRIVLTASVD